MSKFLYKIEKEENENNIKIKIYYLNEQKEIEIKEIYKDYEILIKNVEFEELKIKSDKIVLTNKEFKDINNEKIIKIQIKNKEIYDYVLEQIKENKLAIYEADVPIEHKYLIENNIKISEDSEDNNDMKYLSIDIETIGEKESQEIILISSFSPNDDNQSIVYVNKEKISDKNLKIVNKKDFKKFKVIIVENEKELLEKFKDQVISFSPQALIGWNVIDFDFRIIKERMKLLGMEFNFSQTENPCRLRIVPDFFRDSSMTCSGMLVFDMIQVIKSNYITFDDYKLDTVAKEVLEDNKINLETEEIEEESGMENKIKLIENMLNQDTTKLIEYNFKDSLLVSQITEKLGLLRLMQKRSSITDTPINRVKSPIATLDLMYLKKLHERGYVANSNFNFSGSNQIEGAYVIEPKSGFYEDIFVLDFKSLYPSIIMTFNIDPFTYISRENESGKRDSRYAIGKKGFLVAPNKAKFSKTPGILPELILKLYKERDIAKKEKDDIKSYALKITMNSFYGAIASPKSRFHNRDVGGAITSFGRHILQKAKSFVEARGDRVIYGDTDSIFVKILGFHGNSLEDKKKAGKMLEKEINKYFNSWIKEEFGQKSYLDIEMEKLYSKFFIASKKRYVGYDEFTQKNQFVGMEAIRGDWTKLAQRFQVNLVKLIFSGKKEEEIKEFIKKEIDELKSGKYDDLLIYRKKITKPLSEYTKTTPPHVRAAREVENFEGREVKYVMTKDGPKHISLLGSSVNYDYDHYIEKQLNGVSDDLLKILKIKFMEIVKGKQQKNLSEFF